MIYTLAAAAAADISALNILGDLSHRFKDRGFWKVAAAGAFKEREKVRRRPSRYGEGFARVRGVVFPGEAGKLPSGAKYGAKLNKFGRPCWGRVA